MKSKWFKKKLPIHISNIIDNLLSIVIVIIILIGVYLMYDKYYVYYRNDNDRPQYRTSEEVVEEIEQDYENAVAWLYIEDTISLPVMQGKTNAEYLNKAPDGTSFIGGSLFVDYRNSADLTDDYTLIYGHHMANEKMFGVLDRYYNESYWTDSHLHGILTLKDGTELPFTIFAVGKISALDEEVFAPTEIPIADVCAYLEQKDFEVSTLPKNTDEAKQYLDGKRILCMSTCQDTNNVIMTNVFATIDK